MVLGEKHCSFVSFQNFGFKISFSNSILLLQFFFDEFFFPTESLALLKMIKNRSCNDEWIHFIPIVFGNHCYSHRQLFSFVNFQSDVILCVCTQMWRNNQMVYWIDDILMMFNVLPWLMISPHWKLSLFLSW